MRKIYAKLTIITFLITCFTTILSAQKGTVQGRIINSADQQPLSSISVAAQGTNVGAYSDDKGNFKLSLDPGTYNIQFSSMGFKTLIKKVTVAADQTATVNVTMEEDSQVLGMFVKTEGKYEKNIEEVTVTLEVVKPSLIQNKNNTSVEQTLQQVPGLTIVDKEPQIRAGSGYSFGAGSRVLVMVDDIPLLSGDAGRPSWGFVPLENIEQIEIIKGASSVLYGSSALNGVINVRTAYPKDKPLTKITTFMGMYDIPKEHRWSTAFPPFQSGANFLHSRKIGNFDLVVGGNLFTEKGFVGPSVPQAGVPVDSIYNGEHDYRGRINFNTRYRFKKVEGLAIGLNGNFMYSNSLQAFIMSNDTLHGVFRPWGTATSLTKQTTVNVDPYLTYQTQNGSSVNVRLRYFHQNNDNDNNQGNLHHLVYGEVQYQKRFLDEKSQNKKFLKNFVITTGLTGTYTYGIAQLYAGTAPNPQGVDSVTTRNIYSNNINGAIYAQLENKFFNRLTVNIGARMEIFQTGKYDSYDFWNGGVATRFDTSNVAFGIQPVFRGGLNFRAAEHTYIRASFGQGYRFPTIAERFIRTTVGGIPVLPSLGLVPESSWSAELGIKQGFKIGKFMGYFDAAGFYQRYYNYIEFTAVATAIPGGLPLAFTSFNTGDAHVAGADISIMGGGNFTKDFSMTILAGYNYALPQSLSPNYAYATDMNNNPVTYENTSSNTDNNILKYRFQHTVKVDVEFTYKIVSLGVSCRYNSFMQNIDKLFETLGEIGLLSGLYTFRNNNQKGDYVIDLRAACQINPNAKLSFLVNNVANRMYTMRPGRIEAPRSFIVQLQYQF